MMYQFNAVLIKTIDGDTVDLELDLGLRVYKHVRIRLAGIDAPERGHDGYEESKIELDRLLRFRDLRVQTEKTGVYGRWIGTIWIVGIERSVNEQLVAGGFARIWQS